MWQLTTTEPDAQTHTLDKPRINLGRDESNDIVLESEAVSGFHASLFNEAGGLELIDVGSRNGTRVNGRPISGRVRLEAGDIIDLGGVTLRLERQGQPLRPVTAEREAVAEPPSGEPVARLLPLSATPAAAIAVYDRLQVGRAPDSDLRLDDELISAQHAVLEIDDAGNLMVRDLGSTNGSFVNGQRIDAPRRLQHGDELAFDRLSFRVELSKPPVAATRVRPAIDATVAAATRVRPAVEPDEAACVPPGGGPEMTPPPPIEPVLDTPPPAPSVTPEVPTRPQASMPDPIAAVTGEQDAPARRGVLHSLFSLRGRMGRKGFFLWSMALLVIAIAVQMLIMLLFPEFYKMPDQGNDAGLDPRTLIPDLVNILLFAWPALALAVKRLHDLDRSGWWSLLGLLPLVNLLLWLFLLVRKGSSGSNRFGADPAATA